MEKHYPTKAAAAYCGVAASTLQRWRYLGTGPAFVRISGRLVVYREADLDSWLLARRVEK
jgi:predicted DNA-binding transcriptional regulator AlpA